MRKHDAYEYQPDKDQLIFTFESVGPHAVITKVVEFTPIFQNVWNLGFGDKSGNSWNDIVVSNNNDMRMVMQTVANIVHDFSDRYPERKIYIEPVDHRRKTLYNRIFQRYLDEIMNRFVPYGLNIENEEHTIEPYNPKKLYDAFVLEQN